MGFQVSDTAVKVAKAPLSLLHPGNWFKAFAWFSVIMLVWFILGSSIVTVQNVRENGLSKESLEPLWGDLVVPLMGGGTAWYYAVVEIKANGGKIPIVKPELVLSGRDGIPKFYDYLHLGLYHLKVAWLYVKFFLSVLVAPFLFPFWLLRGMYKYQKTHNWELDALKITIMTYLIILVVGGQISLYTLDDDVKLSGREAIMYEYKSIVGYVLLPYVLFGGEFESGYHNFVVPKVKAEQRLGVSNGTVS